MAALVFAVADHPAGGFVAVVVGAFGAADFDEAAVVEAAADGEDDG